MLRITPVRRALWAASAALAVPTLVASELPATEITFGPAEGTTLSRTYVSKSQFALDDMQMSMNGQPMPMEIEMEMDMEMTSGFEVSDTFLAMAGERPGKLKRTFDSIDSNGSFAMEMEMMPGGGQTMNVTASSELEGKTVLFSLDGEESDYEVSWHESEGDDELLEGLSEDMDLRALLPTGAVSEGDTWDIDTSTLVSVLAPGGNLALVPEMDEDMGMPGMGNMNQGLDQMLGEMLEGTASGVFKGTREVDGVNVAVIGITIDIDSSNDMTEIVREQLEEMPEEMGELSVEYMDAEVEIEVEGTLFWNLSGKHAHSLDLSGSMRMVMDMAMNMSMSGQEMQMEQMFEMSGTIENSMKIAAE